MRKGPRAVGELLVNAVPELRDRLVEFQLRGAWKTLVGADVARRARPDSVVNGCLHVVVDNSPWLQELTLRSAELTARINARFETIRALRFSLGRLPGEPESPASLENRAARALNADDLREIDATVTPIRDPDVRAAARRLLSTARRSGRQRGAV